VGPHWRFSSTKGHPLGKPVRSAAEQSSAMTHNRIQPTAAGGLAESCPPFRRSSALGERRICPTARVQGLSPLQWVLGARAPGDKVSQGRTAATILDLTTPIKLGILLQILCTMGK